MKRYIASLLCCFLLCAQLQGVTAIRFSPEVQSATAYAADIPYTYPYRVQTWEWDALGSPMNRLAACQIPEVVIARMSTPALLQTIFDSPFIFDTMVYSTLENGFLMMRTSLNGIDALLSREDCFDAVYAAYQKQTINVDELTDSTKAFIQNLFLEILVYQEDFLSKLTLREKIALAILVDEKNMEKRAYPQIYSPPPKSTGSVVALAALLCVTSALLLGGITLLATRPLTQRLCRVPVRGVG